MLFFNDSSHLRISSLDLSFFTSQQKITPSLSLLKRLVTMGFLSCPGKSQNWSRKIVLFFLIILYKKLGVIVARVSVSKVLLMYLFIIDVLPVDIFPNNIIFKSIPNLLSSSLIIWNNFNELIKNN